MIWNHSEDLINLVSLPEAIWDNSSKKKRDYRHFSIFEPVGGNYKKSAEQFLLLPHLNH